MRKPLVAGNWKMNNPHVGTQTFLTNVMAYTKVISSAIDIAVFPPFVYLKDTQKILADSKIHWGTQNVSVYDGGAHTGEISASMIKKFGSDYVLIGHSERRYLYETLKLNQCIVDQIVAQKYAMAINYDLIPIICIGETSEDYDMGRTEDVIARLLDVLIEHRGPQVLSRTVLAYEPIWAIGTGKSATPEWVQYVHSFMRKQIAEHDKTVAESLRIIYGGSVNPDNSRAIFDKPDVDGGLIGGASLDAEKFNKICLSAAL
ncbi:MAG: triose-phosphate isomerase [Piscirickettsiaceae bacterium]|nr:triose-phosphate isomerase [Piscirickettsiaceae bacterium]